MRAKRSGSRWLRLAGVVIVLLAVAAMGNAGAEARTRHKVTPRASISPNVANIPWSAFTDLSSGNPTGSTNDSLKPALALGHEATNQSIHVGWLNGTAGNAPWRVKYSNSTDSGAHFGLPETLSVNQSTASSTLGDIAQAVDSKGQVHVLWTERPNSTTNRPLNVYYRRRNADGKSWTPALTSPAIKIATLANKSAPDVYSSNPGIDIAVSSPDIIHIVWAGANSANNINQNWAIYYANSVDGGVTWNNFSNASDVQTGEGYYVEPYILAAPDGSAHVVWHGGNGVAKNVLANHYHLSSAQTGAGTWGRPETIDTYGQQPTLARDPQTGDLYTVYQGLNSSNDLGNADARTLRLAKWTGTGWTAPVIIVDNVATPPLPRFLPEVPSLVIDPGRTMYLTYDLTTDSASDGEGIYDSISGNQGNTWARPEAIEANQRATAPRLKFSTGMLHLVYAIRTGANNVDQIYYRNAAVSAIVTAPGGTPTIVDSPTPRISAVVTLDLHAVNTAVTNIDVSSSASFAAGTSQTYAVGGGTDLTAVLFDLADPNLGGSWAGGQHSIFVRYRDASNNNTVARLFVTLDAAFTVHPTYHAVGDGGAASETVAVFNPQKTPAAVVVTYYTNTTIAKQDSVIVLPGATTTFDVKAGAGAGANGARVESDTGVYSQLASAGPSGALDGAISQNTLAKTWYFPASDAKNASTVIDLLNPFAASARVVVNYYPDGQPSTQGTVNVPLGGKVRLDVAAASGFSVPTSVQLTVTSTNVSIAAARRVVAKDGSWLALSDGVMDAASAAPGAIAASQAWYFPAGTTAGGANETITLFNPATAPLTVAVRYDGDNIASGAPATLPAIPPNSRSTFTLSGVQTKAGAAGIKVSASAPFVAERTLTDATGTPYSIAHGIPALYDYWYAPGITTGGTSGNTQAHVCVQNPNSVSVYATFSFRVSDGSLPGTNIKLVSVPSQRTYCANISATDPDFGAVFGKTVSAIVQTADERTPQMLPSLAPTHYPLAVEYGYGPASGDAAFLPALPAPNMADTEK